MEIVEPGFQVPENESLYINYIALSKTRRVLLKN